MLRVGSDMKTPNLFGWLDSLDSHRARRTKADPSRDESIPEDIGPRGLMIRDPYASQILNGQKIWEIRGRPTQIRGPVVIVKSGTGRALGPLELEDLEQAPELPKKEREEFALSGLPYPRTYAYVFTNPQWFERPIPYRHASGAVTWVRLPDINLDAVQYAASPLGVTQPFLV
jgi:hypothetical protein